jgi:hypothetical protein
MFVFDLINFVVGAGAGSVVTVVVPKVFSWVKKQETSVVAKATVVANTAASVATVVEADAKKL